MDTICVRGALISVSWGFPLLFTIAILFCLPRFSSAHVFTSFFRCCYCGCCRRVSVRVCVVVFVLLFRSCNFVKKCIILYTLMRTHTYTHTQTSIKLCHSSGIMLLIPQHYLSPSPSHHAHPRLSACLVFRVLCRSSRCFFAFVVCVCVCEVCSVYAVKARWEHFSEMNIGAVVNIANVILWRTCNVRLLLSRWWWASPCGVVVFVRARQTRTIIICVHFECYFKGICWSFAQLLIYCAHMQPGKTITFATKANGRRRIYCMYGRLMYIVRSAR